MRVLITRPEDDAKGLTEKLSALGVTSRTEPLMVIDYKTKAPNLASSLADAQALLFTSANGVRAFAGLSDDRTLGVVAVGPASAKAARDAGFVTVESASGDVKALADLILKTRTPDAGALLHVAGTHVAGDLKGRLGQAGFEYRRAVLYEGKAASTLSRETTAEIMAGTLDGILFYSPRTATIFADLVAGETLKMALGAELGKMTAYCLSDGVADMARSLSWGRVRVAAHTDEGALLEIIAQDAVA